MVISTNTTIYRTVIADEVRVVNNAILTVTGILICRVLIVEAGAVILEGSGIIYVVDEPQKFMPHLLATTMLQTAPVITAFSLIYLSTQLFKEIQIKK